MGLPSVFRRFFAAIKFGAGNDHKFGKDGNDLILADTTMGHEMKLSELTGWHGSPTRIKIFPKDFISSDVSNPEYMAGASNQVYSAGAAAELTAAIPIPTGFKATHVRVYASATKNVAVYEADINASILTSKGSGDTTAEIDITDVTSDGTNFLRIEVQAVNGAGVYGGYITIAPI